MQKCLDCYVHSSRMDRDRVKLFVRKLEDLSISDYYGLKSPGLTCYLNSVLQVLFMTADFREAVKRRCSKHSASLDQHLGELFCGLERTNAKTHNIIKQLGITDVYEQRDAAEYFEKILCRSSSEASKIFRGELNHETTCCKCNNTNHFRSFFWVLPLSMDTSSRKSYSVLHGLEDFFKVQKVSKENQMFCNSCKKKQDADTKYELIRSPDVLTLLLKRFTFDYRWRGYIKLQCKADVVRTLNLQNCRYDLYAVVHHCGYLTGGHYTADIKSFETGNWYCFNDDTVKSVKQKYELETNSIRSSTAYLLMYRKETRCRGPLNRHWS
ncbi:ubiquitin carboxyl-terminal hydrolase 47 isoform X3 [Kryptolebias marmoratus]|uniref:ubiquitin carboxyl-terminal hydrolase 47 isoform X3 n=1 Tax=Kryptolebias marmoratus TaxID=37003 RepID=UPI0007F8D436|nr:ubiquitin carboxyl-terminal hydrolase 47 isoform X3 [Kryptolebias marmoratus]